MGTLDVNATDPLARLVPAASVLLLALVDLLPLPSPAPGAIAPMLALSGIFFWSIHRPDLFGPLSVFMISLVLDAAAGVPLGLTALALLVTASVLLPRRRFMQARSFTVVWLCFMLVAILVLSLRWLFASIWWWHAFRYQPVAFEIVLTIAAYPMLDMLFSRTRRQIASRHASGS